MQGALADILVIDLSRFLPGPYCSMILADHGARVIAVEDRRFAADAVPFLEGVNRNKEHVSLNLKSEGGRSVFLELARRADVILEGFRPGVTDRLGVGYAAVREVNPQIIYCSVTGYGQTGDRRHLAGHDLNFAGYGGALSLIGPADGPPSIPGLQLGDISGGFNAVIGVLMALFHRERTGTGQAIDISMTDAVTATLPLAAGWYWTYGEPPARGDFALAGRYAYYNLYETGDGRYVTLGAIEPRFWQHICHYFGVPEYIPLQLDEDRREEIIDFFRRAFARKTRDEWLSIFEGMDVCVGGVLSLDEVLEAPDARRRGLVSEIPDPSGRTVAVLGSPIRMTATPGEVRTPPPRFGEGTRSILKELGYPEAEIEAMGREGVF